MTPRAGSKALIREINEALVLDVVRAHGPVTRGVIGTRTGLSAATITGITAQLLRSGLLRETDVARDTGGRPARLLTLGRDAVFAAGVRLTADHAHVVLVDLSGEAVAEHREAMRSSSPVDATAAIARAVEQVAASRPHAELIGIGVSVSGIVDQAGGVVRHSGALGWESVPLRAELDAALGVPVVIDSHVNAFASSELLFDGRLEGRNLMFFSIGTSLGASVVVQGRIHRGFNGAAGGFAHWHIDGSGARGHSAASGERPCHCGATGCLETWSSQWGIERELERRGFTGAGDDAVVAEVLNEAADHLGVAIANACKLFGPERIVLAFAPELEREILATRTADVVRRAFLHEHSPAPALEIAVADAAAVARGAAYIVLAQLFSANVSQAESEADDAAVHAVGE